MLQLYHLCKIGSYTPLPKVRLSSNSHPQENIDRVHHIVMNERRLTVNQVANAVGISTRWVPRPLTPDQAHQAGPVTSELGTFWSRFSPFSWTLPHPRLVLGPQLQRPNDNPCNRNTPLHPSKKRPRWCHRQWRWTMASVFCRSAIKEHCVYWLPSERPNYQWGVLCQLAEAAAKGNQVKTAWKTDEGSRFSPGQCSCTQDCSCNGWCALLWLWIGWSPSIFWFGTILLFSVAQPEKLK